MPNSLAVQGVDASMMSTTMARASWLVLLRDQRVTPAVPKAVPPACSTTGLWPPALCLPLKGSVLYLRQSRL